MTTDEYVPDEDQVRAWCREGTGDYPDVMDEWLDRFLARVRRDAARDALDRAEHRIARLEAQTDIRGRAVVMYRERAREAEAERDAARGYIAELETAVQSRNDVIKHRDARLKAVRDIHTGTIWPGVADKPICDACDQTWPCETIRALEG